jgi:hypothetical protein
MNKTAQNISRLKIGIIFLTVATAAIHLIVAFIFPSMRALFILNGLGYLALLVAYFLPQLSSYRNIVRWLLIAFAAVTIIGYFVVNGFKVDPLGWVDKAIEIALIVLLWMDGRS